MIGFFLEEIYYILYTWFNIASYLYQVHLYYWLETNDYGRFLADNDL